MTMSPIQTEIFITGVTGYIGGSILSRLLEHPDHRSHHITVLVRSEERSHKFQELGIKSVTGSLKDLPLLEDLAANADIVISTADSDDLDATRAILQGQKRYHALTGRASILIHTSGTGVLTDDAVGNYPGETIYDDMDLEQIESLADTQLHRDVDLEIVKADKEGYIKSYIILPSTIYGIASGRIAELGLQNRQSIQIPVLIRAALARGRSGIVGEGKNIWVNVHIDDIADLYIVLFNAIKSSPDKVGHGREGFYFGENGEHTLYQVGKAIGEALVSLGKTTDPEPSSFTKEEVEMYLFGNTVPWGTNSRCRANRSRLIGWAPSKTTSDLFASVGPEIETILKERATA